MLTSQAKKESAFEKKFINRDKTPLYKPQSKTRSELPVRVDRSASPLILRSTLPKVLMI